MAQLVERYVRNVQATSSNLVISTISNLKRNTFCDSLGCFFYCLKTATLCRESRLT